MEAEAMQHGDEEEEEFVLLDLGVLSDKFDISPNAPYVLSGLDTLNPILIIDGKLKLIGEYEETIGTCFVFSETEAGPVVHEETGPSEENLFAGKQIVDSNQTPRKQLEPVARLHKILKFRMFVDDDDDDAQGGELASQFADAGEHVAMAEQQLQAEEVTNEVSVSEDQNVVLGPNRPKRVIRRPVKYVN